MPSLRFSLTSCLVLPVMFVLISGCSVRDEDNPFDPNKTLPAGAAEQAVSTTSKTFTPVAGPQPLLPAEMAAQPDMKSGPMTARTVEQRIAALEEAVGSMQSEYSRMAPVFASLNTTNQRVQSLLEGLEQETDPRPAAAPPAPVKAAVPVKKTAPKTVAKKTKPAPAKSVVIPSSVQSIRIGEHGNRTRVVFDLSGSKKPAMTYDIDNNERLLLVEMPGTAWKAAKSGTLSKSGFISAWSAHENGRGGSTVAIQLKKNARLLSNDYLPSDGAQAGRLVIDIGPAD